MGVLFKSVTDLLSEAAECEETHSIDFEDIGVEEDIFDILDDVEEMNDELSYNEEMVHVICQESSEGYSKYLVEFDMLSKYMQSTGLPVKEALIKICEHNCISLGDTYLVIESVEDIRESVQEAKATIKGAKGICKDKAKKKLDETGKTIKDLKDKGVKLLKKKSKCK